MNNNYNYSGFSGISLTTNNELDYSESQQELQRVAASVQDSATENRIENMLSSHSKYYEYCE